MASYVYDEFRLTLTPRTDGDYDARGVGPDGVVHGATFRLPFAGGELERRVLGVAHSPMRSVAPATRDVGGAVVPVVDAEELGGALATALLAGDVGVGYDAARRQAVGDGRGLRLTLSLGAAPALLSVPWELLYRRPTFLANQRQTPVVRLLDVPGLPEPPIVDGTVRILGVVANPPDTAPLDVAAERARVERAVVDVVAGGRVTLDWLEPATPRRLREVLRDGTYHVLHYVGHGDFTPEGEGVLYLEAGEDGSEIGHAELDSTELASLLADQTSLRLVVLNACDGARTTLTDPFAGVATTLVQLGVPAVVAMQFAISDAAAILFAEELYTNLIGRQASIDAAVSEARKAIYIEQGTVEWATPVLFMGDTEVELWTWTSPSSRSGADPVGVMPSDPVAPVAVVPSIDEVGTRPAVRPARRTRRSGVGALVGLVLLVAAGLIAWSALRPDDDPNTGPVDELSASGPLDEVTNPPTSAPSPAVDVEPLTAPVTVEGSVSTGGDAQDFPIDLAAGQIVYIGADPTCGADVRYELLGPAGELVSGYARPVCQDIGRIEVTSNGTHTLHVESIGAATGGFSFTVTPVRPDLVAPLSLGSPAIGTIDNPGERHRYTVDLTSGDTLYAAGRVACGADLRYQLYSPSGQLTLGYDRPVCQDGGRTVITETGPHELRVDGRERATGPYDVVLDPVRADGGGPLVSGTAASGTIDAPGAEDVWTFDAAIGDNVSIVPQVACGAALQYEVRSPSGALPLGYNFRICDPGSFTVNEAGSYTLRIYGRERATGPYALTLTVVPG